MSRRLSDSAIKHGNERLICDPNNSSHLESNPHVWDQPNWTWYLSNVWLSIKYSLNMQVLPFLRSDVRVVLNLSVRHLVDLRKELFRIAWTAHEWILACLWHFPCHLQLTFCSGVQLICLLSFHQIDKEFCLLCLVSKWRFQVFSICVMCSCSYTHAILLCSWCAAFLETQTLRGDRSNYWWLCRP